LLSTLITYTDTIINTQTIKQNSKKESDESDRNLVTIMPLLKKQTKEKVQITLLH
jgi:hypothetical protein